MKICFIVEYYLPHIGGAEVLFQHLAEGLVQAGHTCEVITCRLPGTPASEVINGVQVRRVRVPRFGDRYWFTFAGIPAALRHARDADIIHTMVYNGALPAKLASLVRKKPSVVHVFEVIGAKWHHIGISLLPSLLYRMLERLVLAISFDAYSCISISTMDGLQKRGIPVSTLFLAYPGIDYSLFDPRTTIFSREIIRKRLNIPEDRFLYISYGRPGYVKGIHHLVAAVPLVKKSIRHSTLLLILSRKPTEGRRRIEGLVRSLGLIPGEDIIIIDPVPRQELPSFIASGDCVVVPSLSEGFGFTCVEACAMRRPVVATTAGSLPEVVSGRYVLVEPGDPEALAQGIIRIERKEYDRSEEKRFLWEDHVRKHEEVYRELIQKRLSG